jgi:Ala-tRNA(Pro) deacylase
MKALRYVLRRELELATETELHDLFADCATGAVPPVAEPYGIPAVVDERLWGLTDVWFEAGDHEDLVHMSGESFEQLMSEARPARFSKRVVRIH